jgi:TolA-binding protein
MKPLAKFVNEPTIDPVALQAAWGQVQRRVRVHHHVRRASAVLAGVAFLGIVATFALRTPHQRFLPGQSAVAQLEPRLLDLAEGSQVVLDPEGEVELTSATEQEVVMVLKHGKASFDVAKRPNRRFVVKADDVQIRVVGTQFTVQRLGTQVEVSVTGGIVEVRDGVTLKRLERGDRWSRTVPSLEVAKPAGSGDGDAGDLDEGDDTEPELTTPLVTGSGERRPPHTIKRHRKPIKRQFEVEPTPDPTTNTQKPVVDQAPAAAAPLQPARLEQPDPKKVEANPADTFASAIHARGEGHTKEAIGGFQLVCERWPSSAYAPMSAFEWGRLALDSQHDPRQAVHAFERTLELATSASLVEDALARLAEAYSRYDVASCRRVQADYLRRFPAGQHVRGVTKACPPP